MVIDEIKNFLSNNYGTVHRGIYDLSIASTKMYNSARKKVQHFIKSPSRKKYCFYTRYNRQY